MARHTRILNILISTLIFSTFKLSAANTTNFITDALVENLSCNNLSEQSIYASIKPEAFASNKHIPIRNWSFANGSYSLGVCWSLSHTQRLFFYLAKWEALNFSNYNSTEDEALNILNLIRNSKPIKGTFGIIRESNLKTFYTFKFHSFSKEAGLFADLINGIWDPLRRFFPSPNSHINNLDLVNTRNTDLTLVTEPDDDTTTNDQLVIAEPNNDTNLLNLIPSINSAETSPTKQAQDKLFRKFTTEVERYQRWRFHNFNNSKLATEAVPRSTVINQRLSKKLTDDIDNNRLPLVDIKPNIISQHIVLIKFYETTADNIKFFVYDSNHPEADNYFIYDIKTKEFKAPEIIKRFSGISNPNQNISVYAVDDADHDKIAKALLSYYKIQCK